MAGRDGLETFGVYMDVYVITAPAVREKQRERFLSVT